MQQLFSVAEKYEYWLASRDENAAIGISLFDTRPHVEDSSSDPWCKP
jgi:hypothetical protein